MTATVHSKMHSKWSDVFLRPARYSPYNIFIQFKLKINYYIQNHSTFDQLMSSRRVFYKIAGSH